MHFHITGDGIQRGRIMRIREHNIDRAIDLIVKCQHWNARSGAVRETDENNRVVGNERIRECERRVCVGGQRRGLQRNDSVASIHRHARGNVSCLRNVAAASH